MKNRYLQLALKVISFVLCFVIIYWLLQTIYVLPYVNAQIVDGFYSLDDNSVDVLFLGASQLYCGINAQKLTDEYGISAYDFGGGGQPLLVSYYYLQEALKRQKPKVVCIEMCRFFDAKITSQRLAYNYPAMPMTAEKYNSLLTILDEDRAETITYYLPFTLIAYHSWWNQVNPVKAIKSILTSNNYYERGFCYSDDIREVNIKYLQEDDDSVQTIPKETIMAISNIVELCRENDIELVFIKVPTAVEWTRNDSKVAKTFMEENDLTFVDLFDHLDEIGIDEKSDFRDENHLNTTGANKVTDFIANYLIETFDLP